MVFPFNYNHHDVVGKTQKNREESKNYCSLFLYPLRSLEMKILKWGVYYVVLYLEFSSVTIIKHFSHVTKYS